MHEQGRQAFEADHDGAASALAAMRGVECARQGPQSAFERCYIEIAGFIDETLQCDARAVAEAEEIGLRDLQLPKQPGDIVGRILECDGLIAIGRASGASAIPIGSS